MTPEHSRLIDRCEALIAENAKLKEEVKHRETQWDLLHSSYELEQERKSSVNRLNVRLMDALQHVVDELGKCTGKCRSTEHPKDCAFCYSELVLREKRKCAHKRTKQEPYEDRECLDCGMSFW